MEIVNNLVFKDFVAMEAMELEFYSKDHITSVEESYKWYIHNKKSFLALKNSDELVAFSTIFSVDDEHFELLKNGLLTDKDLTYEKILKSESEKVFLSCIVVKKNYQKLGLAKYLFLEHMKLYPNAKIVLMEAVTDMGKGFAIRNGFVHHKTTELNTNIFIKGQI